MNRKFVLVLAVIVGIYVGSTQLHVTHDSIAAETSSNDAIADAFDAHRSGIQVTGQGVVSKVLSDDNDGSRHQRFILRLESGQTILVAHNIDLAPRLPSLMSGDTVLFNGVYEWNAEGGVIHWTHRDPDGQHLAGWLKHNGETFQ